VLDPANGIVTFGDGEMGFVPPKGARMFAIYETTRAEKGNLPAKVIKVLSVSAHNSAILKDSFDGIRRQLDGSIRNVIPARGGQAAETLDEATGRAIRSLNVSQRAVTLRDYETLALNTPGTHIARAKAIANTHDNTITVAVLPYLPLKKPAASPGLLKAVFDYLNRRRVIGTHLRIVGPEYNTVGVFATVAAKTGEVKDEIRNRIETALNQFFDPLRGGQERSGWPFGRTVYISEVLQAIDEVQGVAHVRSLELVPDNGQPLRGGQERSSWPFRHTVSSFEAHQAIDEVPEPAHVRSLERVPDNGQPQSKNLPIGSICLVSPGPHRIEIEFAVP